MDFDMGHGGEGDHGGGHGGHGGAKCSMKMLFNWDTENLCIIFSWWHISNIGFLILSCFIIILLAASFESLRYALRVYDSRIYEASHARLQEQRDTTSEEVATTSTTQTTQQNRNPVIRVTYLQQIVRTLIHTIQVFLSFFLMLVFMTYNGFLMISVVIGAAIGYFIFAKHTISNQEELGLTCH